MTEKSAALRQLEEALGRLSEAEKTIQLSKGQIKESLSKLKTLPYSDDERLSLAKHLMGNYDGCYGINKIAIAKALFDGSWPEMERRLGPKEERCMQCGSSLHYLAHGLELRDHYGFFRERKIPRGWNCLACLDVPGWMLNVGKSTSIKSKVLRRFSQLPFSLGEFTYGVDHAGIVRFARLQDIGEPDFPAGVERLRLELEAHLASGDLGFVSMPKLPKINLPAHQRFMPVLFCAGNKKLDWGVLHRINDLPGIEIAPKISGATEPMVFRFESGAGMLMPVKPNQFSNNCLAYQLLGGQWAEMSANS